MTFDEVLRRFPRVALVGGPNTGKTHLSERVLDRPVIHTDDLMDQPWAQIPDMAINRVGNRQKFLIEGALAARTVRRGLKVDAVVHLKRAKRPRTEKQEQFSKGVDTVVDSLRGVPVIEVIEDRA